MTTTKEIKRSFNLLWGVLIFMATIIILGFAMFFFCPVVEAGEVTSYSLQPPTTNEDGTLLNDLAKHTFYCSAEVTDIGLSETTGLLSNIITVDGQTTCYATSSDFSGNESDPSNSIKVLKSGANFFISDQISPSPPTLIFQ